MTLGTKISRLELQLLSGAVWSLLGAGICRALLLGASVVSGRLLGVVDFGKLGMVQSTAGLLGAVIGAGLGLATTEVVARTRASDPVRAGGIIVKSYRLALAFGAGAALLVLLLAVTPVGRPIRFTAELQGELRLGAALALFGAVNAVQGAVLAGLDGFRPLAFASVARGIVSFLLIALGARQAGLRGALAGQVLAELLSAAAFHAAIAAAARAQRIPLSPAAAPGSLRSLTGIALPTLLGTVVLQPIFWACNVLLVSGRSGYADLGLFNAADRWRQLLLFIPASLSANVLSALSRLNGAGDGAGFHRIFRRSLALMLLVVLVPAAAVTLCAPLCLRVFGAEYRSGALALAVLAGSSIPNALNNTLGQVLITRGKIWWRFFIDLGLGAILLGTASALVPTWGATGLAAAHLLAYGGAMAALAAALRWSRPLWPAPGPAAAVARPEDEGARLVHVATVPQMLFFLRGQVGFMKRAGFTVGAIASPGPALARFGAEQQIPTWGLPMSRRISPLRDLVTLVRLVALLRRVRPTILHAHTPKGGLLGMLAGAAARVPVRIYHLHGLPLETSRGLRRWLLKASDRVACALAHRVLVVSPSLLSVAVSHGLVSRKKAAVPASGSINGIDVEREFHPERHREAGARVRALYRIPPGAPVAGFVGRLVRDKGVVELAEAWQVVRRRHRDARLLIVGPLDDTDPVPPRTMTLLREDPRVALVGPDWDVAPFMAAMNLLVLPTYREGLGNVLLEAGAMGLPVVATRITGCVDAVVDARTGMLVPPRDPAALAEAMSLYLGSEPLRASHGAAAREHLIRNFSQGAVWKAMYREYEAALQLRNTVKGTPGVTALEG
ncbi:MAG TPA: glycosyltransferase [Myxococcaceae bacterium]|jgi:glycosyltransferase involved in cell wall biosynthesis/O-antigen/teichoic acid export membrane protein